MQLQLHNRADALLIHSWELERGRHRIRVGDAWHGESLIITPATLTAWQVTDFASLTAADFAQLAATDAEVVLLGAGARARFPDPALTRALIDAGIGLEAMDTAAACRTYNVLAADGRKVAAGLIV